MPGGARGVAARAQRRAARRLVPVNRKYPLAELLEACNAISKRRRATSSRSNTACSTASTTSPSTRASWSRWSHAARRRSKFNLIPFNPFPAIGLQALAARAHPAFAEVLQRRRHRHHCARRAATTSPPPAASSPATSQDRTACGERIAQRRTVMLQQRAGLAFAPQEHDPMSDAFPTGTLLTQALLGAPPCSLLACCAARDAAREQSASRGDA